MVDLVLSPLLASEIAKATWDISNPSRGGGQSISGSEQTVVGAGARWVCTLEINVFTENTALSALAFRSLKSKLRGRDRVVRIPDIERRGPAWLAGVAMDGVPHSDGTSHADGTRHSQSFTDGSLPEKSNKNQSVLNVRIGSGLSLLPGQRFSIADGRMHEISDILSWDGGNIWGVEIWPWLRASYPAGTLVDFDYPSCRMKLAEDKTGILEVTPTPLSVPSIDFTEAL